MTTTLTTGQLYQGICLSVQEGTILDYRKMQRFFYELKKEGLSILTRLRFNWDGREPKSPELEEIHGMMLITETIYPTRHTLDTFTPNPEMQRHFRDILKTKFSVAKREEIRIISERAQKEVIYQ